MEQRVDHHVEAGHRALLRPAAAPGDPDRALGESLRGEVAERGDHLRLDQLDLPHQVGLALLDFLRQRIAIARRPTHQYVRYEDIAPRQPDLPQQLVQQPPRTAYERLALLIFGRAGRLADEHQVRVGVAHAEDDVRPAPREGTAVLVVQLLVELDQLGAAFLG